MNISDLNYMETVTEEATKVEGGLDIDQIFRQRASVRNRGFGNSGVAVNFGTQSLSALEAFTRFSI